MADDIDRAQRINERYQENALAVARRGSAPKPSRMECLDCEESIPEARRKAQPGCQRCVSCQEEFENITANWRAL